jgi:mono/diheme cytochrome c family protein
MRNAAWMIGAVALVALLGSGARAEDDGKAIYAKKCRLCHAIGDDRGAKADLGGPLDGVGSKRTEDWIRAYLADPKSRIDNAKMPKIRLSEGEMDAVVKYMLSLQ